MKALLVTLTALLLATPAAAKEPPVGTWAPDGVQCRIGAEPVCRYVAPDCELVRVMDPGTRWVLWCRPPRDVE